jgi:hypothetical protein
LVGEVATAARKLRDDIVGERQEVERELVDVELLVSKWHPPS